MLLIPSVIIAAELPSTTFGDEAKRGDATPEPEDANLEQNQPQQKPIADDQQAVSLLNSFCIDCHHDAEESSFDLMALTDPLAIRENLSIWTKISNRLSDRSMPPSDSDSPSDQNRLSIVRWIQQSIIREVCEDGLSPSGPIIRRLNRTEYANTVRDLLGIHVNAAHALPVDGAGGEGFDNAAETLFISPIHAEKYLDAAKEALSHAMLDPSPRDQLLTVTPNASISAKAAAEAILERFLPRAFRRPINQSEKQEYLELFEQVFEQERLFEPAIQLALEAAMVSPKFLFHLETTATTEQPAKLNSYEMASRLSYFLWASMPDRELLELASQGKLQDDSVLEQQVKRMLNSHIDNRGLRRGAKVREFATSFTEQWLGTRAIGREFEPAAAYQSRYDSELEGGMKYEPIFFFEDLLSDNRSLLELIDSDFTYLNNRLARHYKIQGEFREQPKRTELPEDSVRGGLLGMSAVLAVSSLPHRTSPVLRGKWIMETMLGTPPAPPPADVPELDGADHPITSKNLRERLEQHRSNPTCASCHASLDPLGFGLEKFDVLGTWRDNENGIAIDSTGQLPDGTSFNGSRELKQLLMQRKDQFTRQLTSKMLGFALGRSLTFEDHCTVDQIAITLRQNEYRIQTLVTEIVKSVPFRYKQGILETGAIQNPSQQGDPSDN
ncbi:DUF1592 domain-containing protein [bacterium]|nr:DUF1592 domain-containing protein [bacterium]